MWNLPGPGIEPVSPALPGEFLSTVPPEQTVLIVMKSNFTIISVTDHVYGVVSKVITLPKIV